MSTGREGGKGAAHDPAGTEASHPDLPNTAPTVLVVADDLIWSTRLADALRHAEADPRTVRSSRELAERLADADGCVVDLTARAYDGVAAVAVAAEAGIPVIAVGQHDDADLRRAATTAGAARVFAYRRLFEHGDADLAAWVAGLSDREPPGTARGQA